MRTNTLLCLGAALLLATCLAEPPAEPGAEAISQSVARNPKLFFGGLYTTVTRVSIVLTTTGTRYYTCISSIANTMTCTGRRRRRNVRPSLENSRTPRDLQAPVVPMVHSSMSDVPETGVKTNSEVRDERLLLLTIYTTMTSSYTLGTYTSDTGTTVSISVACFDPSFSFPPNC